MIKEIVKREVKAFAQTYAIDGDFFGDGAGQMDDEDIFDFSDTVYRYCDCVWRKRGVVSMRCSNASSTYLNSSTPVLVFIV